MRVTGFAWLALLAAIPPLAFLTIRAVRRAGAGLAAARLRSVRLAAFLALRIVAVLSLALALAGLTFTRLSDRLSVVFLLDQSESVAGEQRARAVQAIEDIRAAMNPGDAASLVRFGAGQVLEELSPGMPVRAEAGGDVEASATNISAAIQFAIAQAPAGGAPRLVLLSDGNENRGSAEDAVRVARSLGVRVFTLPLGLALPEGAGREIAGEVSVEDIRTPARVRAGEPHEVVVLVRSRSRTGARVSLFRDGVPFGSRDTALTPGENAVSFTGLFAERGLHAWDALVATPRDGIPDNNHWRRFVEVSGGPQVLYASRQGQGSAALLSALAAQGISVVSRSAAGLPGTLAGYLPYDAVLLDDLPAYGLSFEKMDTIARYVRDAGGGLLMIGGENSFGAGGYYRTPIETALPVDMDVKSQLQLPRLSLVIVADKSGSMGSVADNGQTKLDVVKSAALSAVELLNPFDRVGLLAFDADFVWTVPLTEAGNREKVAAELASLAPGGGTVLYPALEEAYRSISASASPLRHIIILSDGLTNPGEFEGLVSRITRDKITVSTVAVGEDADAELLARIAKEGGGRFYATNDAGNVPRIFMTETILVSRGLLVEKSFIPLVASAGEILRGIPPGDLPPLNGFVLTYAKTGAEVLLSGLYDAPLLASWRYGLGRSAVFTSDLRGRWSRPWLEWELFPRLAAQLVRWIERPGGGENLHPVVAISGGRGSVRVDAYDGVGAFVNGLALEAVILGPGETRLETRVAQTAPGLYSASFEASRVGDYIVTISSRGDAGIPPITVGASVPYSEEYRMQGVDAQLLQRIAEETGGRLVETAEAGPSGPQVLTREFQRTRADTPWRILLLVALAAFFLDILARKLVAPEGLRARLAARLRSLRAEQGPSYEELTSMVEKARDEEKKKLRARISGMVSEGRIDPDLAAYLYIARMQGKRAEKKEKGE